MQDDNTVLPQVVQKQATVGQIIKDYIQGKGISEIAEFYGVAREKVTDVIKEAERLGKFIPKDVEVPLDKLTDTPERMDEDPENPQPLKEGENPPPGKGETFESNVTKAGPKATTANSA